MKIRNGFVSNSSSSSFVILGKKISEENVAKYLLENYYNEILEYKNENGISNLDLENSYDIYDLCYFISKKTNKEIELISTESHGYYLGEILAQVSAGEDEMFDLSLENGKIYLDGEEIELGDNNLYIFEDLS